MAINYRKLKLGNILRVTIKDILGEHSLIGGLREKSKNEIILASTELACICGGRIIIKSEIVKIIRVDFENKIVEEI